MSSASPFNVGPVSSAAEAPLYQQVVEGIVREIAAGRLTTGDTLPSVRALSSDLVVSIITVKRAYKELEQAGIIYIRQGVGAFVASAAEAVMDTNRLANVRAALDRAVAEARRVHLSDPELIQMLRSNLKEGEG